MLVDRVLADLDVPDPDERAGKPRLAFDKDAKPHFWVTRKDYEEMPS